MPKTFIPFSEAREIVHSLGLKNKREYESYIRGAHAKGLPRTPHGTYASEWQGWPDFLGTETSRHGSRESFVTFEQAKLIVRELGISTRRGFEYRSKELRPRNMPACPDKVYDEWNGWDDFLAPKPEKVEAPKPERPKRINQIDWSREKREPKPKPVYTSQYGFKARGAGIRRTDEQRSADEGQMTDLQMELIRAVDDFKQSRRCSFPNVTDIHQIMLFLGYRRVAKVGEYHMSYMSPEKYRHQKRCVCCEKMLPEAEFGVNPDLPDGRFNVCDKCLGVDREDEVWTSKSLKETSVTPPSSTSPINATASQTTPPGPPKLFFPVSRMPTSIDCGVNGTSPAPTSNSATSLSRGTVSENVLSST